MPPDYFLQCNRRIHHTLAPPAYSNFIAKAVSFEHGLYARSLIVPHNQVLSGLFRSFQSFQLHQLPAHMSPVNPFNRQTCHAEFRTPLRFCPIFEEFSFCALVSSALACFGTTQQRLKRRDHFHMKSIITNQFHNM
jgi:hypothetical protein